MSALVDLTRAQRPIVLEVAPRLERFFCPPACLRPESPAKVVTKLS